MALAAEILLDTASDNPDFALWEKEFAEAPLGEVLTASADMGAESLLGHAALRNDELVRLVPSLEFDAEQRERAARLIGRVATGATVEHIRTTPTATLLEALQQAHEGDGEARRLVEMNVRTDVIERTIKAGHVMSVNLEVNKRGQVLQHGQTAEMIQTNSLRYAANSWQMRERTEAETRNMFRIEALHERGLLEDHAFVVISRAADNMSLEQAEKTGFFTSTMSCAIQVTTVAGQGLTTESAFVAGKMNSRADRHDAETTARLGAQLGVDLAGKTAAELIDTPLLVPKRLIPNGAVDLVRLYDLAAGGTFFGEAKSPQDYLEFLQRCRQRELELEPSVQDIVNELIAQAPGIRTPLEATERLGKLSGAHMLKCAVDDERIDGLVFGVESAAYLEAARYHAALGDTQRADAFLARAQAADTSSSCPGAGALEAKNGSDTEKSDSGEGDGDCDFISKKCPLCGTKNVRTLIRKLPSGQKHISGSCGCSKLA
jgi:hypothetical protein